MSINSNLNDVKTINSVIPEGCLTFAEQSLYVAEFAEKEFNALFEAVGIDELAVFESTGSFVVYEGAKLDEFKKNAVKFFKETVWGAIKGAYEKILGFFETKRKEFNNMITSINASAIDLMKDDKKYGTTYNYDLSHADNFEANTRKLVRDIAVDFGALKVNHDNETADINAESKELKDKYEAKIVSEISGISDVKTVNDARKSLHEKMKGEKVEVNKTWVKNNFSTIVDVVKQGSTKKDIQKSYKAEKASIDEVINGLKKMDGDMINFAKAEMSLLKSVTTALHSLMNVKMDVCKTRYADYRNILIVLHNLNKKSTNESAQVEESTSSSYTDIIESAFDW